MQHLIKKTFDETGWGIPASVVLHLTLALLLLYPTPELPPPPQEQSVHVELVPPNRSESTAEGNANTETKRSPLAFESASTEKEPPSSTDAHEPAMRRSEPQKIETKNSNPVPNEDNKTLGKSDKNNQSITELGTETERLPADTQRAAPTSQNPILTPDKPTEAKPELTSADQIYSKDTLSDPRVKQAIGKLPPRDRIVQICGIEALEQVRHHRPGTFPDMLAPSAGIVSETSFTIRDGAFRSRAKWYSIDFQCQVDIKAMKITDFSYSIGKAIPEGQWNSRQLPRD